MLGGVPVVPSVCRECGARECFTSCSCSCVVCCPVSPGPFFFFLCLSALVPRGNLPNGGKVAQSVCPPSSQQIAAKTMTKYTIFIFSHGLWIADCSKTITAASTAAAGQECVHYRRIDVGTSGMRVHTMPWSSVPAVLLLSCFLPQSEAFYAPLPTAGRFEVSTKTKQNSSFNDDTCIIMM